MTPTCRCVPRHLGAPVDAATLNAPAEARLRSRADRESGEVDCLIVPGFTPRFGWRATSLHPVPDESCAQAARDLQGGVAPFVIVSGGAVHGPANEAVLMREALLARGVAADRVLLEPCARHTTTNLRNAARLMLAHGLRTAYVVAPDAAYASPSDWLRRLVRQAFYVGYPRLSSFHLRCRRALGYTVGDLAWVRPMHVFFVPSRECLRDSPRATAEGDP